LAELVLKDITDHLERGESVKLSSFSSFVVWKNGSRMSRNPNTGKEVPTPQRRVMGVLPWFVLVLVETAFIDSQNAERGGGYSNG
jgi:integration host factor subunit alpha